MLPSSIIRLCSRTISRLISRPITCCRSALLHRQVVQVRIGDRADLGVLQRGGAAGVRAVRHAIEAHQLAGHVEAADLLAAVGERQAGLEGAAAHRVDELEVVAFAVQRLAGLRPAPAAEHQAVQALDVAPGHAAGQAQVAQVAGGALRLERCHGRRHAGSQAPERGGRCGQVLRMLRWSCCGFQASESVRVELPRRSRPAASWSNSADLSRKRSGPGAQIALAVGRAELLLNTTKAMSGCAGRMARSTSRPWPPSSCTSSTTTSGLVARMPVDAGLRRFGLADDGHGRRRQHGGDARADQGRVVGQEYFDGQVAVKAYLLHCSPNALAHIGCALNSDPRNRPERVALGIFLEERRYRSCSARPCLMA